MKSEKIAGVLMDMLKVYTPKNAAERATLRDYRVAIEKVKSKHAASPVEGRIKG